VAYGELLPAFRAWAEEERERPLGERITRRLAEETLPYPGRLRLAAAAARLARPVESILPDQMKTMLELLPRALPAAEALPAVYPATGERRARVALLAGCVQNVLAPDINWATLRVLSMNGVETIIPDGQGCCGSLAMHTGAAGQARSLARKNLEAFPTDVDAIIVNAAGCGSGIKEYGLLFAGQPEEAAARQFGRMTQDVSEFLHGLGLYHPPPLPQPLRVAYHDACHLAHAQDIRHAPRALLGQIPGLTLVEIADGDLCCGSAGTYNLEQPAIAHELGRRKAQAIVQAQPDAAVMGNIGCMVQIQQHLTAMERPLPVYHTVQLLDLAYGNGKQ
jgi:glycolate oxidase iron-sulfur subunit